MRSLKKVLIANRGEIAVRILRGLHERRMKAVVAYSEADRESLAVLLADEAYCIGPAPSSESYLRADVLIDLAKCVGADAIHPGYGFLSENAEFAEACEQAGLCFIGPSAAAIRAMGSKIESRRLMVAAGVPVVPGGTDAVSGLEAARAEADRVGYPVMIKASAGGGGKGMRRVTSKEDLAAAFRAATSEAKASFGDESVYVERYIEQPRHIEIQVLGDEQGTVISLGERECSLQRRHQKVVEEAPSAVVGKELRKQMGEAAVRAAQAVDYTGAGTVEFLLDESGEFYFLEMNTRLQVEHPVTELVTGIDLVQAQLLVAEGKALLPAWLDVEPRGHAIEVRVYAEDPYRGFAPSPGRIEYMRLPEGPGVRNDFGIAEKGEVSIHYDPMLGKLIVWAEDRERAIERLRRALDEMRIDGIKTTLPLFRELVDDEDFRSGTLDIGMLDRKLESGELGGVSEETQLEQDLPLLAVAVELLAGGASRGAVAEQSAKSTSARHRASWARAARREAVQS